MKITEINAKTIITKSNLPNTDFVINPYTGCSHACIYCYADFMKRFTNHNNEKWGSFIDVKKFDVDSINLEKYNKKILLFSSVTDPYQGIEAKYKRTRTILEKFKNT
ncbi:hypothetical protein K9L97_02830 [Candidatus Woesearchaeota archaeon]|nr:hypothetical protein [Candidatus Woesearchaeota archaeon]